MAKLSKQQAKLHQQACDILAKDVLTDDDKWFVLENFQESANHVNSTAGAFFTPPGLANDFAIEIGACGTRRIIDLCAGIGSLSFMCRQRGRWDNAYPEIVCVELNPDYVAVGKKILPEASWICGSVFDLQNIGRFDFAISNPPFGATARHGAKGPRYAGDKFEYHVIDVAAELADYGVFIIPQASSGFRYSGQPSYQEDRTEAYKRFSEQTGIQLQPGCGIDCDYYRADWHGVSVSVEVVTTELRSAAANEGEASAAPLRDLFGHPLQAAA